ncbi:MAG TPA: hypothetical protein VES97_01290, partial [Solirubrobacteraceae bacterium]|nr:hypothetical protein [Solirubrobacteraceae bacterium]
YISESGPFAKPPLSPPLPGEEAGEQENTIYLRSDAPLSPGAPEAASYEKARENGNNMKPRPNPGFLPLVTKANAPGPGFGREIARQPAGIVPAGATPDLSHVVFASELVANGLYEWSGGENQLVSVIEEGGKETRVPTPAEAHLGSSENLFNRSMNVRHAISNDGSRVFWTYKGVHLEVRDTETRETLQLDTVQPEASGAGEAGAVFQTANGEGTRVFFTDGQRLTADSGATASAPDLYVADVSVAGGHVSSAVTDLTPHGGEGADVLLVKGGGGGVIGASEDGSYVYFVANGALTPDAARGRCSNEPKARPRGTTCNLYVRHHNDATGEWEPTKLIAALSFEDMPDWGGGSTRRADFAYMTSRVSPNGRYLAFMSNRSLTGYDNEDVSGKGRLDEEVFLYDANEQRLVCVSCNPTGARPRGVFDAGLGRGGKGEGLGLVADRPEIWSEYRNVPDDHWLAGSIPGWTSLGIEDALYQSRYLLDSGRLYFNSADALVSLKAPTRQETVQGAEQEVGVENVYEYEPNATGGCQAEGGCVGLISSGASQHESAFLDASASGNDVFFLTAGKLSPRDVDTSFDVYDAHVCGSECPSQEESSPPPCQEEACQGSFSPGPAFAPPASATSSGSGNIAPLVQVLGAKTTPKPAPKPLTRAQKLARALKACRKNKQRSKRLACERQARKKYGPVKPTAKKSSTKATG